MTAKYRPEYIWEILPLYNSCVHEFAKQKKQNLNKQIDKKKTSKSNKHTIQINSFK